MLDNNTVLLTGACDEESTLRSVYTYHFPTENLVEKAPMVQPRIGHAMIRIDEIVYVFGGFNFGAGNLDTCENF
jgi:hypothetical protein